MVELEDDPVPIVKIIGAQLKRAMASDSHRRIVSQLDGCFSLSSVTDPQKVSVNINNNNIAVSRGINPQAKVVIHLDFKDAKIKPRIDGRLRYPVFAIKSASYSNPRRKIGSPRQKATGRQFVINRACLQQSRCLLPMTTLSFCLVERMSNPR